MKTAIQKFSYETTNNSHISLNLIRHHSYNIFYITIAMPLINSDEEMDIHRTIDKQPFYKQACFKTTIRCLVCTVCCIVIYFIWLSSQSSTSINIPPKLINIPQFWIDRASRISEHKLNSIDDGNETVISNAQAPQTIDQYKLVCYYSSPSALNFSHELYPKQIDPFLCTHINIGIIPIDKNSRITIDNTTAQLFGQMVQLKQKNPNLKILIWIGGPSDSMAFLTMIANYTNRMAFIESILAALQTYQLDGIDLDWEFPLTFNHQKEHFSQLFQEIRHTYQRNNQSYLMSVAVAAPEGIAFYAYDIKAINKYCDYVNIMTYDYHFYSMASPFTGLNAPLYARHDEHSIFAILNINASAYFWHKYGLDKDKIVIGLPTYGHSFKLVNALNARIGSPASGYGQVGSFGFVTYADVCWFIRNNFFVRKVYDEESCSPYITAANEWISYEDERSITCKTKYVRDNGFGGVMIFSLNTDDYASICYYGNDKYSDFPLIHSINSILFAT